MWSRKEIGNNYMGLAPLEIVLTVDGWREESGEWVGINYMLMIGRVLQRRVALHQGNKVNFVYPANYSDQGKQSSRSTLLIRKFYNQNNPQHFVS